jgi:hypothetical protein
MPVEMYGESLLGDVQACSSITLYMAECRTREESKVAFIAQFMWKLIVQVVRPTQHEQTVGNNQQSQSQCLSIFLYRRVGKLRCTEGDLGCPVGKLGVISSGSTHNYGCVVNNM